jgi:cell volume regulation protein A
MSDGVLLLATGALLAGALGASLLASRLRIPGLVVVLGIGMAIGSDGFGWIHFGDYHLAETIGVIALSLILFEGGLAAGLSEIRPVLGAAVSLAILGTLITAVIAGLAAAWLFDLSTLEGLLVGSIVASTDGAAIFALLRGSTLRRRVARTLEGEAGLNDPVAVLLVLGFIDWIQKPDYGIADMLGLFVQQVGIGLVVGVVIGVLAVGALRRARLASAGLYPVASMAAAALAYGTAATLHGSGFLAVYLCGLSLGSAPTPATRTIATFHDGLAWIAQLSLFLALGLLVFPSQLGAVAVEGTLLAFVVAVVARPVAVFVATATQRFSVRERAVLGWAGLRGAVPVVLAIFPVEHHVPHSLEFFNIAFFAVVLSTVLQGATFVGFAERLGVTTNEAALPTPLMEASTMRRLGAETVEFPVRASDAVVGHRVRELGLPREALLNVIVRGQQAIPPRGSTVIEAGDRLHVIVRQEVAVEFRRMLDVWRTGPLRGARRHAVTRGSTVFSTRPWRYEDGDPSRPEAVGGIAVVEQLRTRRDAPGALVALADGRFAYTGKVMAVGSAQQVQDAARRRLRSCETDADGAWWREVIGALAVP